MKFVWEINKEAWNNYKNEIMECIEVDGCPNTAGVVGVCRVGDLCFDIRAWGDEDGYGIGYELFVANVDTGYNKTKNGMPYDLADDYDEFPADVLDMSLEDFEAMAEPVFEEFINKAAKYYRYADLLAKVNAPTNYFL